MAIYVKATINPPLSIPANIFRPVTVILERKSARTGFIYAHTLYK